MDGILNKAWVFIAPSKLKKEQTNKPDLGMPFKN